MNHNNSNDHLLGSFTIFVIFALLASTTLLAAGVLWLSELLGSTLYALTIVGLFAALIALFTYFATLRRAMQELRERVETLYEVANLAHRGYHWIIKRVISLFE